MPKVSVIIPVYNVEKYLPRCLDSLLAQTLKGIEIICVDDGSTDNSAAILNEYAKKDSRITVVRQSNAGAGAARNAGLDRAAGEYLFFFDPDDSCEREMLETMYRKARRTKADVVVAGKKIVDAETGELIRDKPLPRRLAWLHRKSFPPTEIADILFSFAKAVPWDKLFRRSFVLENRLRFQEIPSSNDACFTYAALSLAGTVSSTQGAFVAHRKRDGSIEASRSDQSDCIAKAILAYRDLMITRGMFVLHSHLERDFKSWALHILFWHLDSINSLAGYEKLYSVIPGLAKTIGLDQLDGSKFEDSDDSPDRLAVILKGGTPVESIRFHERTLIKRIEKTNYYKRLALSWDYRLGNTILRIPRWLRHLARG